MKLLAQISCVGFGSFGAPTGRSGRLLRLMGCVAANHAPAVEAAVGPGANSSLT